MVSFDASHQGPSVLYLYYEMKPLLWTIWPFKDVKIHNLHEKTHFSPNVGAKTNYHNNKNDIKNPKQQPTAPRHSIATFKVFKF